MLNEAKHMTIIFILIFLITPMHFALAKEKEDTPDIGSNVAVSIDVYDGEVIFGKDEEKEVYPASITKILTAILLEENLTDSDLIVASEEAIKQDPSNQIYLMQKDEVLTKDQALKLIMMISSNDVSHAIAETISGSVEKFSELMNERAKELGAKNSNFENPNGLPNEKHKTTALDMALITKEVLNHPNILEAMQQEEFELETNKQTRIIQKTHSIIENNENALGGKTGWTTVSGNTLAEIVQKGDNRSIVVIMGANGREEAYKDVKEISDYSLGVLDTEKLFSQGEKVTEIVKGESVVNLYAKDDIFVTLKGREKIENQITIIDKNNYKKNEVIANLIIMNEGEIESTFDLFIKEDILIVEEPKEEDESDGIVNFVKEDKGVKITLLLIFGIPIIVFSLLVAINSLFRNRIAARDLFKLGSRNS